MKINVKHELLDLDDQPIVLSRKVDPETKQVVSEKRLTVAHAATEALLGTYDGEQPSAQVKLLRFTLASRIAKADRAEGVVELKTEELATVKEMVAKAWSALAVGRFEEAVERDAVVREPEPEPAPAVAPAVVAT